MRIDISHRHGTVSEVLRAYIARRLQFALSRVEPHLIRVAVFLTDLCGPHDGPDKQCRMVATLRHGKKVIAWIWIETSEWRLTRRPAVWGGA